MSATFAGWADMPFEIFAVLVAGLALVGVAILSKLVNELAALVAELARMFAAIVDHLAGDDAAAGDDPRPAPPVPLARAAAEVARGPCDRLGLDDPEGRN